MKQWFFDMQKEVHVLGPLLPSGYGIETQKSELEEGASLDVEAFLGEMQVQHGKRSVFYASLSSPFFRVRSYNYIISPQVSFGTLFWPPVSEYINELIEALIEKKAPFVCDSWYKNL
jgi:hypothetical protein